MANRFFVNGGVDNLWSTTGNWSTTSGGGGGSAVPLATDDVFFDGNSPNCTINTSARVGLSLTFTGYTNTITFDQTLTITNNITLVGTMTFAGSSALININTSTFTSNGKAVGVPLTFSGVTCTITLADALVCSGLLTLNPNVSSTKTINGFSITANAGITIGSNGASNLLGTTTVTFTAGTYTGTTGCSMGLTLTFNGAAFTISGTLLYRTGTLTYTAGTATVTGVTLNLAGASASVAVAGITWPTFTISGTTATYTLLEDVNCVNLNLLPATSVTHTLAGAFNINCSGNLTVGGSTNGIITSTTAKIVCSGAAAVWSNSNTAALRVDLDINTAGTFTVSAQVNYNTRTLRWVAGTMAGASSPKLRINVTATTLDFGGQTVPWIIYLGASAGNVNLASGIVFSSAGGLWSNEATAASPITVRSSSSPTQRKLTIVTGCSIDVAHANFTDIDCGDGDELWVYGATLSNTTNITNAIPYTSPLETGGGGSATATGSFG